MKSWPELIRGSIYVRKSKYQYSWFSQFNCDKRSMVHLCKGSEVANYTKDQSSHMHRPGVGGQCGSALVSLSYAKRNSIRPQTTRTQGSNERSVHEPQAIAYISIFSVVVHAPLYCLGNRTRSPITAREAQSTIIYNL